jgi:ectoine hydroxylase-related dioxygenase (phytanoyl-CoA dioxygenase family)
LLPLCRQMMLDRRLQGVLHRLTGADLLAAHSLYSFKPPHAGPPPELPPSLFDDTLQLQVTPGPCVVVWTAVDAALPENGGLQVVVGSHDRDPRPCPADEVPTGDLLPMADDLPTVPVALQPGDVLIFDGALRHGCGLNRTRRLWRRALICHYVHADAAAVAPWFTPALDFAGGERALAPQPTSPDAFRAFLEAL